MSLFDSYGAYRGRFAPSPSGPLHFGSLVAALASYLDAKANKGTWLVRIEDIDTPRVVAGSSDLILKTLEAYGLYWDDKVSYQSQNIPHYENVLEQLRSQQLVYGCQCTRKQIKACGGFYHNTCRELNLPLDHNAIRLKQAHPVYQFVDGIRGQINVSANFAKEDYIVKRRDQLFAYQLVVVLDDIQQKITHIVRGADLLDPTVRQISLFKMLSQPIPQFSHVPLAVAEPGFKLSKQNHAPAIDLQNPNLTLIDALRFLGIANDSDAHQLAFASRDEILSWGTAQWALNKVHQTQEIQVIPHDQQFRFKAL